MRKVVLRGYRETTSDIVDVSVFKVNDDASFSTIVNQMALDSTGWHEVSDDTFTPVRLELDNFIYVDVGLDPVTAVADARLLWVDIHYTPTSLTRRT